MIKTCLANDIKQISGIYGKDGTWSIEIGRNNTGKIEAYLEDGYTPWFAIYKDGMIVSRVNAAFVETVSYASEGD